MNILQDKQIMEMENNAVLQFLEQNNFIDGAISGYCNSSKKVFSAYNKSKNQKVILILYSNSQMQEMQIHKSLSAQKLAKSPYSLSCLNTYKLEINWQPYFLIEFQHFPVFQTIEDLMQYEKTNQIIMDDHTKLKIALLIMDAINSLHLNRNILPQGFDFSHFYIYSFSKEDYQIKFSELVCPQYVFQWGDEVQTSKISWYTAPEVVRNKNKYSMSADLFNLGIMLYQLEYTFGDVRSMVENKKMTSRILLELREIENRKLIFLANEFIQTQPSDRIHIREVLLSLKDNYTCNLKTISQHPLLGKDNKIVTTQSISELKKLCQKQSKELNELQEQDEKRKLNESVQSMIGEQRREQEIQKYYDIKMKTLQNTSQKLQKKEEELSLRESQILKKDEELNEQEKLQTEEIKTKLKQFENYKQESENKFKTIENQLLNQSRLQQNKDNQLKARENELNQLRNELNKKEDELKQNQNQLTINQNQFTMTQQKKEEELQNLLNGINRQKEEIQKNEQKLNSKEEDLRKKEQKLIKQEQVLSQTQQNLIIKQQELDQRSSDLQILLMDINKKKDEQSLKEQELSQKQQELSNNELKLFQIQQNLKMQQEKLDQSNSNNEILLKDINKKKNENSTKEQELSKKEQQLKNTENRINQSSEMQNKQSQSLLALQKQLDDQSKELSYKSKELQDKLKQLEDREKLFLKRKAEDEQNIMLELNRIAEVNNRIKQEEDKRILQQKQIEDEKIKMENQRILEKQLQERYLKLVNANSNQSKEICQEIVKPLNPQKQALNQEEVVFYEEYITTQHTREIPEEQQKKIDQTSAEVEKQIENRIAGIQNKQVSIIAKGSPLREEIARISLFKMYRSKGFNVQLEDTQKIQQTTSSQDNKTNDISETFQRQMVMTGQVENLKYLSLKIPDTNNLNYDSLILDSRKKQSFCKELINLLSREFQIDESEVTIMQIQKGSIKVDIKINQADIQYINRDYPLLKQAYPNLSITVQSLITNYKIKASDFNPKFDQTWSNSQISDIRGQLKIKDKYVDQVYKFPIGYEGFGLNVEKWIDKDKSDWFSQTNSQTTWIVLYHGTDSEGLKGIFNDGLSIKPGKRNACNNQVCRITGQNIQAGDCMYTYLTDEVSVAASYSVTQFNKPVEIKGQKVNPIHVRSPQSYPSYYLISKDHFKESIRPYRILLRRAQ